MQKTISEIISRIEDCPDVRQLPYTLGPLVSKVPSKQKPIEFVEREGGLWLLIRWPGKPRHGSMHLLDPPGKLGDRQSIKEIYANAVWALKAWQRVIEPDAGADGKTDGKKNLGQKRQKIRM